MISIYKTLDSENTRLEKINSIEQGCWINVISPTKQDLLFISKKTSVPLDFLNSALDDEEPSRIDIENNITLIIIDIPFTEIEDNSLTYDTYPLAIINTPNELITICLKSSKILNDFVNNKVRNFYTYKRSRFILQILFRVSNYYLECLRQIDKKSLMIQKKLQKSMGNRELMYILSLRNSLIYFSTSLKSNEITLEKMLKLNLIQKYEEDKDILEDVILENKQAIEMTTIYSDILTGTMEASASVISNNLNIVMKLMTAVTIVMSIPTIISGYWGMNVPDIPFAQTHFGFWYAVGVSLILSVLATLYLIKKKMF